MRERFGHFRLLRSLGRGGGGEVYCALDTRSGEQVALKLPAEGGARALRREYELGARLCHPHIVRYRAWLEDPLGPGLCMQLVRGAPLLRHVRGRPYDGVALRRWLLQLVDALRALHLAGSIHGDVKPEHVLIDERGGVVLVDLGIARPLRSVDESGAGTEGYAAPEILLRDAVGPAADWYGLGAILYELLSGQRPPGVEQSATAPALAAGAADPELVALCRDLLQADPALRPAGRQIARRLGGELGVQGDGHWSVSVLVGPPPFVGRSRELRQLAALFEAPPAPSRVAWVCGPDGVGKRALVRRFTASLGQRARVAFSTGGASAGRPFQALRPFVACWVDSLRESRIPLEARPAPDDARVLCRLFPELRGTLGHDDDGRTWGSPRARRDAACAALRRLLAKLPTAAPLVWVLEGWEALDQDSQQVLLQLAAPSDAAERARRPLWIVTARGAPPVELTAEVVPLGPLSDAEARDCAAGWLRRWLSDAGEQAEPLARGAGGLPLAIEERVRYRLFFGVLPDPQSGYATLAGRRVAALTAAARELLQRLAVAGGAVSRVELAQGSGLAQEELERLLSMLVVAGFVGERREDASLVELATPALREVVAAGLSEQARRQLRDATLELPAGTRPGALSRARQLREQLAFARAAQAYEVALGDALAAGAADLEASAIAELAEARWLVGDRRGAAHAYLAAAERGNRADALRWLERASACYVEAACLEQAVRTLDRLLGRLGMRPLSSPVRSLASLLWGRAALALRGGDGEARAEQEVPASELARVDALTNVGATLALFDPMRGADYQTRGVRWALRVRERRRMARALALEAGYRAIQERSPAPGARAMLDRARRLSEAANEDALLGYVASFECIHAYLATDLSACVDHADRARALLRHHAEERARELAAVGFFELNARYMMGALGAACARAERARARYLAQGDVHAACNLGLSLGYQRALLAGDIEGARRCVTECLAPWRDGTYRFQDSMAFVAEMYVAKHDDWRAGWPLVEAHWPALRRLGLLHARGTRRYMLKHVAELHALSALAQRGGERGRHARAALRTARELRRLDPRLGEVEAQFAEALAQLALDQAERALASLRRCEQRAEELALGDYTWRARAFRARLVGGDDGRALEARLAAYCRDQGIACPDRWSGRRHWRAGGP